MNVLECPKNLKKVITHNQKMCVRARKNENVQYQNFHYKNFSWWDKNNKILKN